MANNEVLIPIPGRLHSVATEGHVAGADEIYDDTKAVTQDVINASVLEEKAYVPADYSGMGRVVLKKNMVNDVNTLTQEAFEDGEGNPLTNTIFVIQYDFVLGEDIEIPAACVLEFDGGSIIGAGTNKETLTGDFRIEAGMTKIFDGVKFSGSCVNNTYYVEWFVENYTNGLDKSKDATTELQSMFDSGICSLYLTNERFYYVTSTIIIPGTVAITGKSIQNLNNGTDPSIYPCFYCSGDTQPFKIVPVHEIPLKIEKFYGVRIEPIISDTEHKENIPFVFVDCAARLWGCYLELYLESRQIMIDRINVDGNTVQRKDVGYTGLEIYVHGQDQYGTQNYMCFCTLKGYYNFLHRAINIHKDTANWTNSCLILFDSKCTYGGNFVEGEIYGRHQTLTLIKEYQDAAYFKSDTSCVLYGQIWDLAANVQKLYSAYYGIDCTKTKMYSQHDTKVKGNKILFNEETGAGGGIGLLNANLGGNIIEDLFYKTFGPVTGDLGDSVQLLNSDFVTCKLYDSEENSVNVNDKVVSNYQQLFKLYPTYGTPSQRRYANAFTNRIINGNSYVTYECTLNIPTEFLGNLIAGIIGLNANISSMSIYVTNGGATKTINLDRYSLAYQGYALASLNGMAAGSVVKFTITGTFNANYPLPKIFICSSNTSNAVTASGGVVGGELRLANAMFFNPSERIAGNYPGMKVVSHPLFFKNVGDTSSYTQILNLNTLDVWRYTTYIISGFKNTTPFKIVIDVSSKKYYCTIDMDLNILANESVRPDVIVVDYKGDTITITDVACSNIFGISSDIIDDRTSYTSYTRDYNIGEMKFISNVPYWWNGTAWVDASGATV